MFLFLRAIYSRGALVFQFIGLLIFFYLQTFSRFLSYRRDNQELLLFLLKQLVQDRLAFERVRHAGSQEWRIEVTEREFAERAKQINISSVRAFLQSDLFKSHHFVYDASRKVIVHTV